MKSPRDELKRRLRMAFVVTLAATLAACDNGGSSDDSEAPARPLVAGFNAVANMGTITFLREEERWTDLEYGEGTEFRAVGADQYDLNFDSVLPGDETTTCSGTDGDGVKDEDE